jgi:hypothetical protein
VLIYRDLLDSKLRDTYRREVGRVDGIIMELRPGSPPRVTRIEAGGTIAWRRVHPVLARLNRALRRWGPRQVEPAPLPWDAIERTDDGFRVKVDSNRTAMMAYELWLREHVVFRIPFSGRKP